MGELIDRADDRPLCPMSMGPAASVWHRAETLFTDRLYEAFKPLRVDDAGQPDPDGELPPDLDRLYSQVTYPEAYRGMYLHHESAGFTQNRRFVEVAAYYWKCHLCGHVLPATTVTTSPP